MTSWWHMSLRDGRPSDLPASATLIDALHFAPVGTSWLVSSECMIPLQPQFMRVLAGEYAALACWCAGLTGPAFQAAAEATTAHRLGACAEDVLAQRWAVAHAAAYDAQADAPAAAADWAARAATAGTATSAAKNAARAARAAWKAAGRASRVYAGPAWDASGDPMPAAEAAWVAATTAAWDACEARAVALLTGGAS